MNTRRTERKPRAKRRTGSPERAKPTASKGFQSLDFSRKNWFLFGLGLGAIGLGFLLLSFGDITLAPILLVGGYVVLIPWALVARRGEPKRS